mmetsp:Transcript_158219/g.303615  ORF Transcript_158219/g.303615 Transcript_158219/m.303615 type:complete len:597 (-) Transcript_158219:13-1803(-)
MIDSTPSGQQMAAAVSFVTSLKQRATDAQHRSEELNDKRKSSIRNSLRTLKYYTSMSGSVFPKAFAVAAPSAILAAVLTYGREEDKWVLPKILMNDGMWGGFIALVGFLVVFRTSQAYNRFWEGCSAVFTMRCEWYDAFASIMAYCKYGVDKKRAADVLRFQNTLIRLFSFLHASALAELSVEGLTSFEIVQGLGVDRESLQALRDCDPSTRVDLVFQWIQYLVIDAVNAKILDVPPPILSRAFTEIGGGMSGLHSALKIARIPFPFVYAQCCFWLLMVHWLILPFLVIHWVHSWAWAAVLTFVQVFTFWTLNFIATALEDPFGMDSQDVQRIEMHEEFNRRMKLLLCPFARRTPRLAPEVEAQCLQEQKMFFEGEPGNALFQGGLGDDAMTIEQVFASLESSEAKGAPSSTIGLKIAPGVAGNGIKAATLGLQTKNDLVRIPVKENIAKLGGSRQVDPNTPRDKPPDRIGLDQDSSPNSSAKPQTTASTSARAQLGAPKGEVESDGLSSTGVSELASDKSKSRGKKVKRVDHARGAAGVASAGITMTATPSILEEVPSTSQENSATPQDHSFSPRVEGSEDRTGQASDCLLNHRR